MFTLVLVLTLAAGIIIAAQGMYLWRWKRQGDVIDVAGAIVLSAIGLFMIGMVAVEVWGLAG